MEYPILYHKAMLAGVQVDIVANNLAVIVDVFRFRTERAGKTEFGQLALKQQEPVTAIAVVKATDNCALVIHAKSSISDRTRDVKGSEFALGGSGKGEANNATQQT